MPVQHAAPGGHGGAGGAPAALPQMAPGVGPDYTSQEPLPGPAAALGMGDKTVFRDFIKAVTQGRALLEPNAPSGVGFGTGTGWVMALPGDGRMETPGATRAHPGGVQPLHPNCSGSHCHSTPPAEPGRGSQCLCHKRGVGNSGRGLAEPRWGLAAIFALRMFLWTSGEL